MRPARRAARPLAVIGLLFVLAGCGVPTDSAPRDIPSKQIPFGLLTTTSTSIPVNGVDRVIFLVRDDRLAAVTRSVSLPAALPQVLAAVTAGPTRREAKSGLRTALATPVTSARSSDGTAVVTLAGDFVDAPIREQILAIGQIVYTATALGGIGGVEVSVDGGPAEVPTAQGSLKRGALTRADFAAIAPH